MVYDLPTLSLQTTEKPFLCSKLDLTDDTDLACEEETVIKHLGTVELQIFRSTLAGTSTRPEKYEAHRQATAPDPRRNEEGDTLSPDEVSSSRNSLQGFTHTARCATASERLARLPPSRYQVTPK